MRELSVVEAETTKQRQTKKRPPKKNQLAVPQCKTNGSTQSTKPASSAGGNRSPSVQTLKVPCHELSAVGKCQYKIKIGDCEYPCHHRDWATKDPSPLQEGEYVACLVDVRACPACGTISMVFVNLDGAHKGRLLRMYSQISPAKEFAQTRNLLSEVGLLSDVQEAMAGEEVKRFAADGVVCLCDVATIIYEREDGGEVEDNGIYSAEVLRIVRSADDSSY